MNVEVINGGLFTTIQDLGRPDGGAYGVPWSGYMDRNSAIRANRIIGNRDSSALLEATLIGPKLLFKASSELVITGANLSPQINNQSISNDVVYTVQANDILSFGNCVEGCRAYIAISGTIDIPLIFGSKSTYTYAQIGGVKGRPIQKGDTLKYHHSIQYGVKSTVLPPTSFSKIIKVLQGPEFTFFEADEIEVFTNQKFTISNDSNRMGYRLLGSPIITRKLSSILSSGTVRGTIQVPNSGLPIVLMADSPTTGGYPRIANCTEKSLDQLAQVKPGEEISFVFV